MFAVIWRVIWISFRRKPVPCLLEQLVCPKHSFYIDLPYMMFSFTSVSSTSCAQRCLRRLKCCNHNEAETFGHLTNVSYGPYIHPSTNTFRFCYVSYDCLSFLQTSTPAFACKFHQGRHTRTYTRIVVAVSYQNQ